MLIYLVSSLERVPDYTFGFYKKHLYKKHEAEIWQKLRDI